MSNIRPNYNALFRRPIGKAPKAKTYYHYGLTVTRSGWRDDQDLIKSVKNISMLNEWVHWEHEFEYTKRGWIHAHCYMITDEAMTCGTKKGRALRKQLRRLNEGDFVKWESLKELTNIARWKKYMYKERNKGHPTHNPILWGDPDHYMQ